jgi:hypothetical protein
MDGESENTDLKSAKNTPCFYGYLIKAEYSSSFKQYRNPKTSTGLQIQNSGAITIEIAWSNWLQTCRSAVTAILEARLPIIKIWRMK